MERHSMVELERRCGLNKSMDSLGPIENTGEIEDSNRKDTTKNIQSCVGRDNSSYSNVDRLSGVKDIRNFISDISLLVKDRNRDSYSLYFDTENQIFEIDKNRLFMGERESSLGYFSYLHNESTSEDTYSNNDTQYSWNNHINSCIESFLQSQICTSTSMVTNCSDSYVYRYIWGETDGEKEGSDVSDGETDVSDGETDVSDGEIDVSDGETDVSDGEIDVSDGETEDSAGIRTHAQDRDLTLEDSFNDSDAQDRDLTLEDSFNDRDAQGTDLTFNTKRERTFNDQEDKQDRRFNHSDPQCSFKSTEDTFTDREDTSHDREHTFDIREGSFNNGENNFREDGFNDREDGFNDREGEHNFRHESFRQDSFSDESFREDSFREGSFKEDAFNDTQDTFNDREDRFREDSFRDASFREDSFNDREDRFREDSFREGEHSFRHESFREDSFSDDSFREYNFNDREDTFRDANFREDSFRDDSFREGEHSFRDESFNDREHSFQDRDDSSNTNGATDKYNKYRHLWVQCDNCYGLNYKRLFKSKMYICEHCEWHVKMNSSDRIDLSIDPDTWDPMDEDMVSLDPIEFHSEDESYKDRLDSYQKTTGLPEAIQTGIGELNGIPVAVGVMDFEFIGGSMGSVVGEKITRLIEYATNQFLPLIIVCASGGARMQEGSVSLIQMAKISSALYQYQSNKKLFYVSILASPTTGGVTASFGMLGDIIIAEPNAYIAFAGKRVIEELLKITVPEGVQETEYLFEKGSFDLIVPRNLLKSVLTELLKLHAFFPFTQNANQNQIEEG